MTPIVSKTLRRAAAAPVLAALALLPVIATSSQAATSASAPGVSAAYAPVSAAAKQAPTTPSTKDSFFFVNGQRSSLTGAKSAQTRMRRLVSHLKRTHVDFGVIAEVEPVQRSTFKQAAGPAYALVTGGNYLDNVVFYRKAAFKQVGAKNITTYYFDGQQIHTTVPFLRDQQGQVIAVVPVHNPAYGENQHWRDKNNAIITSTAASIRKAHPTWGVVVAGDFNETQRPACTYTRRPSSMVSPTSRATSCGHAALPIDQMFATDNVALSGFKRYSARGISDHSTMYHAKVGIR